MHPKQRVNSASSQQGAEAAELFFEEETIDLRHYWRVLMRFKWDIIGLGFVTTLVTGLVVIGFADIYQSTATLMIESREAQITSIEVLYGINSQQSEYFATQTELLKNRNLAEKVISELNLTQHREFIPEEEDEGLALNWREYIPGFLSEFLNRGSANSGAHIAAASEEQILLASVLAQYYSRLSIEPIRYTQLVKIHFEAEDPALAASVANTLADVYIEENLEQRFQASQKASAYLSERLEGLRARLEESERRLQAFFEQEQLINIQGVTTLNQQELDELTSELTEARRRRSELEAIYRQVKSMAGRPTDDLMAFPAILNHEAIQFNKAEADLVDGELAELAKRYGRNHPRMIALASRQSTAQANLERQVERVRGAIENDFLAAVENERSTQARLEQSKIDLQSINRKSFTLNELEREVDTNRALYDLFFTRIRETDETDDFEATNAIVVDPAVAAVSPSKPNRSQIVMVAFVAAIMFGIMLAFLREMLDNTIKTPDDVENRLQATMLGLVALQDVSKKEKDKHLAFMGFIDNTHSGFSESIRTIRTGLSLSSLDQPYKIIAVTSTVPCEGKTTVALNLAIAMGQMSKVLLIDADLRRSSLAKSLGMPPHSAGLTNVVANSVELKSCIFRDEKCGISILPAGQLSPNPLELIASTKFRALLTELSEQFDHIILDTPPTQAVSDALVMGSIADAVVYVVKAGSTSINSIKSGLSRLRYANANVIGIVLNQVDTKKQAYYGGNDYYGGYYDTYGYSSKPSG